MSLNDPWRTEYSEKRNIWTLHRANETAYDENRYQREWATEAEAMEWGEANLLGPFIWHASGPARQLFLPEA